MPAKIRPSPIIPDHEVLRKIGGGSYGEVWLARGVTGALRAVKVVWREDFEDERTFEREFEGILKFEPISRDHPGLVHILHVGRSTDEPSSFYYYVMELGDDVSSVRDINPVEYEPRTLRADNQQAKGVRWDTNDCIEIGIRLAEALHHLHENGLAHRDVKPSNIIFVNGKAKLADIGLVAARGQRTFVGTEGFVPPEGPGSARADVYSLGKVLYEIATGNDRLNFPELTDDVPGGADRKRWLELNRVICEVCEPRLSKRKIHQAADLAEALKRIQRGRRRRGSGKSVWVTSALLLAFSGWIGWELYKDSPWLQSWFASPPAPAPAPRPGMLRIFSSPEGADVIDENGNVIGITPTAVMSARVGSTLTLQLRKRGYRSLDITEEIPPAAAKEPMVISRHLDVFSPPMIGEIWTDQYGATFLPVEDHHESSSYVVESSWNLFLKSPGAPKNNHEILAATHNGEPARIILCDKNSSSVFCQWFRESCIKAGFLTEDHDVRPIPDSSFNHPSMPQRAKEQSWQPFRIKVRKIAYANLTIHTQPPGAQLYLNRAASGLTTAPGTMYRVKPGKIQIMLLLDGYKPLTQTLQIEENASREITLVMQKNQSVVFGKPWENSLGMTLLPLNDQLMVAATETRKADYDAFIRGSSHMPATPPPFEQSGEHPVVQVSREDARAFCAWLTQRERNSGRITQIHTYRLPTDLEWSTMAGLEDPPHLSPSARDMNKEKVFLWGKQNFEPSKIIGNFADQSLAAMPDFPSDRTIPGYNDGFAFTSPVGSYSPSALGFYDLGGNVQEWVEDEYSKLSGEPLGVLRGGGWNTFQIENLYAGSRNAQPPDYRDIYYGFRIVLARSPNENE